MRFGDIIRYKRIEKGYYQIEVERKLDIESKCLSNYELNKHKPSILTTKKLCDFFMLDFEEMLKLIHGNDFELTYGKLFKLRREELGYRQKDVCKILNISKTALENYENDKSIPKNYMARICDLYGFDENELVILMNNLKEFSTFGGIIKYERMRRYLSINELSIILGFEHSTIKSYENNMYNPSLENLRKICKFFELDYEEMFNKLYPINNETLGDLFKSKRNRLGFTQLEVANILNMAENTMYYFENNIQTPGYKSLKTLCDFYKLDFAEINSKYLNIDIDIDSLGIQLKEMRLNKKLSQKQAGELLGVSKTLIGLYERNKMKPSDEFLNRMYKIYEG